MPRSLPIAAAAFFAAALAAVPASAANTRSFVSAGGLDTNSCARTAPCRTLAFAITQTSAGGEINMLDPAGYGPVTITKAISIVNDGVGSAGILVPSGLPGITIAAGVSDKINLRGLIIEGAGIGQSGIVFSTGKSLTIENCVIRHLVGPGIQFDQPNTGSLDVSDTFIADNGTDGIAVHASSTTSNVHVALTRVEIYNNANSGLSLATNVALSGSIKATMVDSVVSNNGTDGISASSASASSPVDLMVVNAVAAGNGTGLLAAGASTIVRLAQSTVTGNTASWLVSAGGVLQSYGDNSINGNGDLDPSPTKIATK
jgi:hypothetical protein